jgi:guanosine-3',5'-bis(diphosphate) 3'-pyrophosphohydrolase
MLATEQKIANARRYAVRAHGNQTYGDEFPYHLHLQAVESVMLRLGILDFEMRMAAWLHDVLEDTDATYEELELYFGTRVAQMVAAVTEPKGGNRKWRHEQTYPHIRGNTDATVLKLCDRIANVESSGHKAWMYVKEHDEFKKALYLKGEHEELWAHLDGVLIELQAED